MKTCLRLSVTWASVLTHLTDFYNTKMFLNHEWFYLVVLLVPTDRWSQFQDLENLAYFFWSTAPEVFKKKYKMWYIIGLKVAFYPFAKDGSQLQTKTFIEPSVTGFWWSADLGFCLACHKDIWQLSSGSISSSFSNKDSPLLKVITLPPFLVIWIKQSLKMYKWAVHWWAVTQARPVESLLGIWV